MPSTSATRSGSSVRRARMVAAFVVLQMGTTRCPTNSRDARSETAHQFTNARYGGAALRRGTGRCVSTRAARDVAVGGVRSRRTPIRACSAYVGDEFDDALLLDTVGHRPDDGRTVHHHHAVSGAGSMAEEADHLAANLHATVGERL